MKKIIFYLIALILLSSLVLAQTSDFNVSLRIVGESCFDGIQNQGEEGVDCGGPCAAECDTGDDDGSSGGSSGPSGGAIVTPPEKKDTFRKYYFIIKENETIVNEFNKSKLTVYKVEFKFLNTVNNVTLEIKNADKDLPVDKQTISDLTYQYFKVSATNVKVQDIDYIKMWFKVDKKWLTEKNTIEEVLMLNYRDDWQILPTTYISNDTGYFYFKTNSYTYGYFSIIGKEPEETVIEPEPNIENPLKKFVQEPIHIPQEPLIPEEFISYILYGVATISLLGATTIIVRNIVLAKFPSWFHNKRIDGMKDRIEEYKTRIKEIDKRIKKL